MKTAAWTRKEGKNSIVHAALAMKNCTQCGDHLLICEFYTTGKKKDGTPKYNSWCKKCIGKKMASYHKRTWGAEKLQFSAAKRTRSVQSFLAYLLYKARQRKTCDLTIEQLMQIWHLQDGKCALTGWNMTMQLGKGQIPTNASIDRIDSSIGYENDNVQLVCRAANVAKSNLTQENFVRLCAAVLEKQNEGLQDTRLAA
jgi:hypothetical protein